MTTDVDVIKICQRTTFFVLHLRRFTCERYGDPISNECDVLPQLQFLLCQKWKDKFFQIEVCVDSCFQRVVCEEH